MTGSVFTEPIVFSLRPLTASNTLFLDRDGVLNHAIIRGSEVSSPRNLEEFKLAEDICALADTKFKDNWNLVIITNQPDLSRGRIDINLLNCFHDKLSEHLSINAIYVCPHLSSDNCECRKPTAGLIILFKKNHQHLKGKEYFIGDRRSDLECAASVKIPFVLRSRYYNEELVDASQFVIKNLHEFHAILKKESQI